MAPSPTMRRLLREVAELSSDSPSISPAFHAAPASDSNLHEWHFTLAGPPSPSPFAGGLYHGRITLPLQYPLKPPNFRFLTPSGRFEVNREICLSISGFHEETWMPAWGVRTALTALRSFMAEKGSAGQVGGLEASTEVRQRLARESRSWSCAGCCSRTNEDIMSEWWKACRDQGVDVEKEMGLETLPEGLNLELVAKSDPKMVSAAELKPTKEEPRHSLEDSKRLMTSTEGVSSTSAEAQPGSTLPSASRLVDSALTVAGKTAGSAPASSAITPLLSTSPSSQQRKAPSSASPLCSSPAPQAKAVPKAPAQPPLSNSATQTNTIESDPATTSSRPPIPGTTAGGSILAMGTVDKAIGAILLALCLMILKKILYPAHSSIDDYDDYGMVTR